MLTTLVDDDGRGPCLAFSLQPAAAAAASSSFESISIGILITSFRGPSGRKQQQSQLNTTRLC